MKKIFEIFSPSAETPTISGVGEAVVSKAKGDKFIWGIVILLSLVSILVVYSAASQIAFRKYGGNTEFFLLKQIAFSSLGLLVIYFIHQINYTVFLKYATYLYFLAIALLIYTMAFGTKKNDGVRWLEIPIVKISFQPSELAKLALFVFLARFITKRQDQMSDLKHGFIPALFIIGLTCVLILPSNLSTAALTFFSGILVIYLGRARRLHVGLLLLFIGCFVYGSIKYVKKTYKKEGDNIVVSVDDNSVLKRKSTWKKRIYDYANFNLDSSNSQENLSKMAIASGNVFWGMGPGKGHASNFLTEAENDFVFSVIIEEYGLLLAALVMFLYIAFLFRSIKIFRRCPYAFGSFLALGLSFTLVIQAMANMGVSVGLLPVTGVTLPLVSMGGTSHILTCASIGIILSVGRNVEMLEGKIPATDKTVS